jgi:hypothetical protein
LRRDRLADVDTRGELVSGLEPCDLGVDRLHPHPPSGSDPLVSIGDEEPPISNTEIGGKAPSGNALRTLASR